MERFSLRKANDKEVLANDREGRCTVSKLISEPSSGRSWQRDTRGLSGGRGRLELVDIRGKRGR